MKLNSVISGSDGTQKGFHHLTPKYFLQQQVAPFGEGWRPFFWEDVDCLLAVGSFLLTLEFFTCNCVLEFIFLELEPFCLQLQPFYLQLKFFCLFAYIGKLRPISTLTDLRWPSGSLRDLIHANRFAEFCGRRKTMFIMFERFARIALNLRFAILIAPKQDSQKNIQFGNLQAIRANWAI